MDTKARSVIPLHSEDAQAAALEAARGDFYALLAVLLLQAPSVDFLDELGRANSLLPLHAAEGELTRQWERLVLAAALMEADSVQDEYDMLFAGPSDPLLNPHASVYLSGFLMDKPLAALRAELGQLGLSRVDGVRQLEDHLGALMETMRVLIMRGDSLATQRHFFERHIACWAGRATEDMRRAEGANFYRAVADFLDAFLAIEAEAFAMADYGEQV